MPISGLHKKLLLSILETYAPCGLSGRSLQTKYVMVYIDLSSLSRAGEWSWACALSDSTVLAPPIAHGNCNSVPGPLLVFAQSHDQKNKRIYGHAYELSAQTALICREQLTGQFWCWCRPSPWDTWRMVNVALSHGPRTGLPKGSNASGSSTAKVLGVCLPHVQSTPVEEDKHSRYSPWLLSQDLF